MKQKTALEALKMGHNIFLTGQAGSGKTYLLNQYVDFLKSKKIPVAVTASTGIAATHMNGITIHSWCGMAIKEFLTPVDLKKLEKNLRIRRRMLKTRVLIIDEISMLHARQLDMVDQICRHFKDSSLPFGGLQVVLCGDFFQLPPVQRNRENEVEFVFDSRVWLSADFEVCYLDEQHRQKDDSMTKVLNGIRSGKVDEEMLDILSQRLDAVIEIDINPTRLYTHNYDVDRINDFELRKISSKQTVYHMHVDGHEKLVRSLKDGCLAPEKLLLKIGAQVMFVKNNFDAGFVNGTMGRVIDFEGEHRLPVVKITSGDEITVQPESWIVEESDKVVASIRQLPLRLAWAITVHKSQGMSLDAVEIELGRAFEYGMGYVALSRARTFSGMRLLGINEMALQVNPKILKLDQDLIEMSQDFENDLSKLGWLEKKTKQKKFLNEELEDDNEKAKAYNLDEIRKKHPNAYAPWSSDDDKKLLEQYKKEKNISDLANVFQRGGGAIRSRLKKLLEKDIKSL